MTFTSWLRDLRRVYRTTRRNGRSSSPGGRSRFRPGLEALEGRLAPAILTVNTAMDETDHTDSFLSLREAINVVNTGSLSGLSMAEGKQIVGSLGSNDTIEFDPSLNGQTITLGALGAMMITRNVNIQGPGAANLTISGNNAHQVFDIGSGPNVVLSGLTIVDGTQSISNFGALTMTDCVLNGNTSPTLNGGALFNAGNAVVTNCHFSGNSALDGGAIFNTFAITPPVAVTLTVSDCFFSGNSAGAGGAIGDLNSTFGSTVTVTGCNFTSNTANGPGGGIENAPNCTLTVSNSSFNLNAANTNGGGIDNQGSALVDAFSTFTSNTSTGVGGGVENGASGALTVDNCTFSANAANTNGGGIDNQGNLTVTNQSTFARNNANINGGGILSGSKATLTMDHAAFSNDTAANFGGGIRNEGTATVTASDFESNAASHGGGIDNNGLATVANCTLDNNTASLGGGVGNGATATLTNCTLADDTGSDSGGGLFNLAGTVTVAGCVFDHDSAVFGGGLFTHAGAARATVTGCTFDGNSAISNGGGIYNDETVSITNCTLANNSAGDFAAGINNFGAATLTNCTVADNRAKNSGGGILSTTGAITLNNTIVAANQAANTPDFNGALNPTSSFNLIGDGTGLSGISNGTQGNKAGTGTNPINPLLAPLGNYGGPTQTMALLPGSPAIDVGSNALALDSSGNLLTVDQRGFARVVNGTVDIGAFESRGFTIAVTGGNNQQALVNTPFPVPLSVIVSSAFGEPVLGGVVTFKAPASGASAVFPSGNTATLNASGQASVSASANGTSGSYLVTEGATTFALTNLAAVTLGPAALPDAAAGTAYTQMLTAGGGAGGPYTFFVTGGALPAGFVLSTSGVLSGNTPTVGTSAFSITAADHSGFAGSQAFSFTVDPGAASQLVIVTQPSSTATAGVAFASQPVVKEEDSFGNVITSDNTHTITAARGQGTAALQGTTTLTLVNGVGTFTNLSYNVAETINVVLTSNAGGVGPVTSNNIVVSPAPASQLVITREPSNTATAGVTFATQPVVKEEDAFGNIITTDNTHTVTAARGSVGTATLQGTTTIALVNGVATFGTLFYTKAETMDIAFTTNAGGFSPATSSGIVVNPNVATHLVLGGPASIGAGTPFTITVTAEDAYGNVATSYRGSVGFTDSVGGASLPPKYTFTAADNGVHRFTGVVVKKKGMHTISVVDASNHNIPGSLLIDVL
jgi:predicted outer membrane repeat protein